jgi:hypothetical protein|nr:MAG TPA: DNA repair protein [Inoviridae sp.]
MGVNMIEKIFLEEVIDEIEGWIIELQEQLAEARAEVQSLENQLDDAIKSLADQKSKLEYIIENESEED